MHSTAGSENGEAAAPRVPWSLTLAADPVLDAEVQSDVILEVRSGKLKPLAGLRVLSGIDKGLVEGPVQVTEMGLIEDEHDYVFHGGVDKAVHGYCAAHYAAWRREFPEGGERFRPGGFGENLVFARYNERNVHVGDVFAVGPADADPAADKGLLLLEVSLPRQPCFKLSHRFGVRHFPANTWRTSRTGWYYRVRRPGRVQAGDVARLVARPQPAWPLARVQEYLHRQPDADLAPVAELAALAELGAESRDMFRGRLERHARDKKRAEAAAAAAAGAAAGTDDGFRPYRVVARRQETARIVSFVLEAAEPDAQPTALASGAHVRLQLGPVDERGTVLERTYSVAGGRDANRFELGVACDAATSRGGARFLHERVAVGATVRAGHFAAGVPRVSASHQVFVAGGVGITAVLCHLEELRRIHYSCELHYAVRAAADVPFAARLAALETPTDGELPPDTTTADGGAPARRVVHLYDASRGQRLDVAAVVRALPWNSHLSVCGPPRLMAAAQQATRAAGLAAGDVHFEAFAADVDGDPFAVDVVRREAASETTTTPLQVGAEDTLLGVLRRAFGAAAVGSSCEVGNCGTCKIAVRSGRVEHRGTALSDEEVAAGDTMLACVSRGIGRIAVEI